MRICMLVRNSCTRDARVLREAAALAEAGHSVRVVAMREAGTPTTESRDGFSIERIFPVPFVRRPVIPPSSPGDQQPSRTPARRSPTLYGARDRLVSLNLTRAALRIRADVYHAHDLNTLMPAARAARRHGARLVYDSHELYPEISGLSEPERRRWRRQERRTIARADEIITVSDSLADELVRSYGVSRPMVLLNVPTIVRKHGVSPLAGLKRPRELMVLYSGGISENRGIEQLAEAARSAHGWHLVIMGWGPLLGRIRELLPSVDVVDPVAAEDVVDAASAADVGVIPYLPTSLNNALSLPNKLFEYVQAGLAIAASDLVELSRFIQAHHVGVVFPPGDVQGMRERLDSLAADGVRLAAMRSAAQDAATTFNWDKEKAKLIDLYSRLDRGAI
jgi:glycogen(starch) synthase